MTSPPTSETQHAPPSQTREVDCPKHGPFTATVTEMSDFGLRPFVSRCPQCSAEARDAEAARKARDEALERSRRIASLVGRSGIPERFIDRTFDGYRATEPGQKIALSVCRAYADGWEEKGASGASLVLSGGPGTGKTHLACAIANSVMQSHMGNCLFATVAGMLRAIKDTYRKDSQRSEQNVLDRLAEPDLLILDEVGVQVGSDHEKLLMFEVLNGRYQSLRSTILISNLPLDELEAFLGQRIMDRYRECGSVLAFDWQSHRGRA